MPGRYSTVEGCRSTRLGLLSGAGASAPSASPLSVDCSRLRARLRPASGGVWLWAAPGSFGCSASPGAAASPGGAAGSGARSQAGAGSGVLGWKTGNSMRSSFPQHFSSSSWNEFNVELVDAVLVREAALLTQLVSVAPELVAVLVELQGVALEGHAPGVLAVHPERLRQLVLVHRGGVVVGQVGLVGAVGQRQRLLAPVVGELGVGVEEPLQHLQLAAHLRRQLDDVLLGGVADQHLVDPRGDPDPLGEGRQLEVRRLRVSPDAVVEALLGEHQLHVLPEELRQAAVGRLAAQQHAAAAAVGRPRRAPHLLVAPRPGHRGGGVRLAQGAVGAQLAEQAAHRVLVRRRHHVHEGLVGGHGEQAVAALVGEHAALPEDAVDLVLQRVLQAAPRGVLLGLVGVSSGLGGRDLEDEKIHDEGSEASSHRRANILFIYLILLYAV
ncbi:hypothetical protein EYF80_045980 [Liparis tanakae]|uniref:Uncharacterized protein n=1 Tax=Liparis tanakae TaxID=230148 RepID=A0A4Z2FSX5_9TELE|nr:hypothetical protein EYF80_045980 [Liparis tanakae]